MDKYMQQVEVIEGHSALNFPKVAQSQKHLCQITKYWFTMKIYNV